jgi:hypothetical protein
VSTANAASCLVDAAQFVRGSVVAGSRNADVALMPSRSTEKRGRDFIIVDLAAAASPDAQVFCFIYDKFCELRDGVNGSYNHLNIELDVRYRTGLRLCGTCTLRLAK